VLIVDDSSAVWPNDRRNLFIVERYIYFPSSRKRLGMAGKSLMEVDRWAQARVDTIRPPLLELRRVSLAKPVCARVVDLPDEAAEYQSFACWQLLLHC
jgi:hypothetical protein